MGTGDIVGKLFLEGDQDKENERDSVTNREKENDWRRKTRIAKRDWEKGVEKEKIGKRLPGLDKVEILGKEEGAGELKGKADDDWERRGGRRMIGRRKEDWETGFGKGEGETGGNGEKENEGPEQHLKSGL